MTNGKKRLACIGICRLLFGIFPEGVNAYCPGCAKKFGNNYMVLFAEVEGNQLTVDGCLLCVDCQQATANQKHAAIQLGKFIT